MPVEQIVCILAIFEGIKKKISFCNVYCFFPDLKSVFLEN